MNGFAEAINKLTSHSQSEVNPQKAGDYMRDGLLYCGSCHTPKQKRLRILGMDKTVPCVCSCRARELEELDRVDKWRDTLRYIEQIKAASLMSDKFSSACFEAYTVRPENEHAYRVARNYVDNFAQMRQSGQGLLLYGTVGTGKSYTAACIANALIQKGVRVVMTSFVKILEKPFAEDNDRIAAAMDSATLLIIDDLGAERGTDFGLERVYNAIDSRVRSEKPMVLTTNLTMEYMKNPKDIRYTRIYDRVFETCYPVKMEGRSFRLDEGRKRYERMKAVLERGGNG